MNIVTRKVIHGWFALGTRFLPFADVATPDLPLSRLLRLSLFQVTVGMALVLLVGTLNRVMIVELAVPASIVAVMISLPLVFAPFRALIGYRSDIHTSALGWRRVPFIWKGTLYQFGGLAIMPFAILVLAKQGESAFAPAWIGISAAALSFLLVGAGVHIVQTVGLALATDLARPEDRPKVVGLMYTMLLVGMIVAAVLYGWLLHDFSPGRLIQVIQGSAVVTVALNLVALWKQEGRGARKARPGEARAPDPPFTEAMRAFLRLPNATGALVVIGLGTMGFGMADVLLEPYGGQVLGLPVGTTTLLTATLAVGSLFGFGLASRVLSRGADPIAMAGWGVLVGIPGFLAIMIAAPTTSVIAFGAGSFLVGFGAGLFGHGTLTATMNLAPPEQAGLALGAWGAVQATAAGIAISSGGIVRDVVAGHAGPAGHGHALPYLVVYGIEIACLVLALGAILVLVRRRRHASAPIVDRPSEAPSTARQASTP